MLRLMCEVTTMDNIRNKYVYSRKHEIAPVTDKLRGNGLVYHRRVMSRDENHITIRMLNMKASGCKNRGRPKNIKIV